jgi:hypothetical protein
MTRLDGKLIEVYNKGIKNKDLFFLSKAVSDDETRYFLNFAYCDGDRIVSTDGRRLHIIKNEIHMEKGNFLQIIKCTKTMFIGFESSRDYTFAKYESVIPVKSKMISENTWRTNNVANILYTLNVHCGSVINPQYAKDVCLMGSDIKIYNDPDNESNKAVLFESGDNIAVIMPMSKE